MKINWISYYYQNDGYGRFASSFVRSLQGMGHEVKPLLEGDVHRPAWMWEQMEIDWRDLSVSCLPPRAVRRIPQTQHHWLYTMCESSRVPKSWIKSIHHSQVEQVLVPCWHNQDAFVESGLKIPIDVVPGGTDPYDFPLLPPKARLEPKNGGTRPPYTFLALGDRGWRKGYAEAHDAFYKAFGGKTTGIQDVKLIIKCREFSNSLVKHITKAKGLDPRVEWRMQDYEKMADLYAEVDCVVMPSRCEGWGMPHREAAMMGLPVITQRYGGLNDGYTGEWSLPLRGGRMQKVAAADRFARGEWMVCDTDELAALMRDCYERPDGYAAFGARAAWWLRRNQTWEHAAAALVAMLEEKGVGNGLPMDSRPALDPAANGRGIYPIRPGVWA